VAALALAEVTAASSGIGVLAISNTVAKHTTEDLVGRLKENRDRPVWQALTIGFRL